MKALTFCLAFALGLAAAHAEDAPGYKLGTLQISQPWSRATPKGAEVAGAYFKITNTGTAPDRLVGGSSPVAGRFEIHQMSMDNGVMKMRPVQGGLEIKPGESVELKPGSYHVMMLDLKQPLNKGDHVKATLTFEKAGSVDIEYNVVGVGETPAAAAPAQSGGGMHDMKGMKGM
jgi:copper(I)-binding protein